MRNPRSHTYISVQQDMQEIKNIIDIREAELYVLNGNYERISPKSTDLAKQITLKKKEIARYKRKLNGILFGL